MTDAPITVFSDRADDPAEGVLPGWKAVEGEPTMRWWREYVADDGSVRCAWWESTPGTWYVEYDAWEFIHLLAGRITITPNGEAPRQIAAGDTFVVENDFCGTWKIEETVLKVAAFKVR